MTVKTETIQVPKEVPFYECNKCHKRIEELEGSLMVGQYRKCAAAALTALLGGLGGGAEDHSPQPHVHASEAQHLCKSCGDLFTQFVNDKPVPAEVH